MKRVITAAITTAATVCVLCGSIASAQHGDHAAPSPDQIGSASVKFETSCSVAVTGDFNKGVALLHSFWFPEAIQAFQGVLAQDSFGTEVRAAMPPGAAVTLIGTPALCAAYATAILACGGTSTLADPDAAAHGLHLIAEATSWTA